MDYTCRVREVTASTGIINTVVGNGTCGYSGDGGPATSAEVHSPRGIALDNANNIYIADYGNFRVRKVTASTGIITTVAGNGTQICCGRSMGYGDGGLATNAEVSEITSVAVDPNGNIYIGDIVADRIREVTALTGIISTAVGNGTGGYSGDGGPATQAGITSPEYVASDPAGNIYFYDCENNRIRKVMASTGIITTIAGNGTKGYLGDGGPATSAEIQTAGLAVDAIGNLYFSEGINPLASSYVNVVRIVAGNAVLGFINPKYLIIGVDYAPPGPSSYAQYGTSTTIGNTQTYTNSFSHSTTTSNSVSGSLKGAKASANGTVSLTTTNSTEYTQASNNSQATTISALTSLTYKMMGTGNTYAPVNNDYDMIWLIVNPVLIYKVNPDIPNSVQFNGYGYDPNDIPNTDSIGVSVGCLNGDFGNADCSGVMTVLERTWAIGQTWPAGEGPGLTSTDYAQILEADPFTNSTYVLPSPLPGITPDNRFTSILEIPYTQASLGDSTGNSATYSAQYTSTSTLSQGTSGSFQETFGVEEGFSESLFGLTLTSNWSKSSTLTWNNTYLNTLTTTNSESDNVTIIGPPCPATTAPCNPLYPSSEPQHFEIYQDNMYGTFMFAPVNN